jgi:hypothetical protein
MPEDDLFRGGGRSKLIHSPPYNLPQFQLIVFVWSLPLPKTIVRKHVMEKIGKARRHPNRKKRKPLKIPLVMSSEERSRSQ